MASGAVKEPTKDDLEKEKLRLEIAELKQPRWRRPGLWAVAVPTCFGLATLAMGIFTGYFDNVRERLGKEQALLKIEQIRLRDEDEKLRKQIGSKEAQLRSATAGLEKAEKELGVAQTQKAEAQRASDVAQQAATDARLEAARAQKVARCAPLWFAMENLVWQGFGYASLPARINRAPLAYLAKRQLIWDGDRLKKLEAALPSWQNDVWSAVPNDPGVVRRSLIAQVLAAEVEKQIGDSLADSPTPDSQYKPTRVTGAELLGDALSAVESSSSSKEFLGRLVQGVSVSKGAVLEQNLFFVVFPSMRKPIRELVRGNDTVISTDALRAIAEEVIRHKQAHEDVGRIVKDLKMAISRECR